MKPEPTSRPAVLQPGLHPIPLHSRHISLQLSCLLLSPPSQ